MLCETILPLCHEVPATSSLPSRPRADRWLGQDLSPPLEFHRFVGFLSAECLLYYKINNTGTMPAPEEKQSGEQRNEILCDNGYEGETKNE